VAGCKPMLLSIANFMDLQEKEFLFVLYDE